MTDIIIEDSNYRQSVVNDLNNLGAAHFRQGEFKKAISYYKQTLAISRAVGDRHSEGSDLSNLGAVYSSLGDIKKAIGYMEQALKIYTAIESPNAETVRKNLECLKTKQQERTLNV